MKHDSIKEEDQAAAALYALGALSQHEAHSFDSHLREGCSVCRSELDGFEQVTASLALGVFEASPSPYLRDVLTARIEREAQDSSEQARASGGDGRERWAATKLWEAVPPFWKAVLPWALAASFFLAFLMAFVAWRLDRRDLNGLIASSQREASSAVDDNVELRDKLKRESALTDELNQINSVLASADRRVLTLAGQDAAPSASAKVYWETKANRWVVSADLPPAPGGKVYQLWFVTADAKISAGLIDSDQNGHGFATVRLPSNLKRLAAAAITLEPAGGSPQPTMPIYALGKA